MKDFGLYFSVGLEHILTWEALDHILFLSALCLRYQWSDWKKILMLITAFTVGHCSTLVLGALNIITVRAALTEFFIALTIIFTASSNFFIKETGRASKISFVYIMAVLFGMIHGLGFAYGMKSIMGKDENITWPLLGFNCGIEIAQLLVVSAMLCITFIVLRILQVKFNSWLLFVSGIIIGLALQMAVKRNPFKDQKNENSYFFRGDDGGYSCIRPVAVL